MLNSRSDHPVDGPRRLPQIDISLIPDGLDDHFPLALTPSPEPLSADAVERMARDLGDLSNHIRKLERQKTAAQKRCESMSNHSRILERKLDEYVFPVALPPFDIDSMDMSRAMRENERLLRIIQGRHVQCDGAFFLDTMVLNLISDRKNLANHLMQEGDQVHDLVSPAPRMRMLIDISGIRNKSLNRVMHIFGSLIPSYGEKQANLFLLSDKVYGETEDT
ncbi:hypothetical protein AX17_003978 [Amanita inopinata Kibby_2008]|nr:hypothetical protein AX17_003978 [Amanita inopinata Kibby_2008]